MEHIRLIYIDIYRIILIQGILINVILDRCHMMIHEYLLTFYISGKTTHPVIHRDNIRIKAAD